jgi:hypothetical protein
MEKLVGNDHPVQRSILAEPRNQSPCSPDLEISSACDGETLKSIADAGLAARRPP